MIVRGREATAAARSCADYTARWRRQGPRWAGRGLQARRLREVGRPLQAPSSTARGGAARGISPVWIGIHCNRQRSLADKRRSTVRPLPPEVHGPTSIMLRGWSHRATGAGGVAILADGGSIAFLAVIAADGVQGWCGPRTGGCASGGPACVASGVTTIVHRVGDGGRALPRVRGRRPRRIAVAGQERRDVNATTANAHTRAASRHLPSRRCCRSCRRCVARRCCRCCSDAVVVLDVSTVHVPAVAAAAASASFTSSSAAAGNDVTGGRATARPARITVHVLGVERRGTLFVHSEINWRTTLTMTAVHTRAIHDLFPTATLHRSSSSPGRRTAASAPDDGSATSRSPYPYSWILVIPCLTAGEAPSLVDVAPLARSFDADIQPSSSSTSAAAAGHTFTDSMLRCFEQSSAGGAWVCSRPGAHSCNRSDGAAAMMWRWRGRCAGVYILGRP